MATWYISPSGSDSTGDGSVSLPHKTMAHTLTHAANSDTIRMFGGVYDYENPNITGKTGLTIERYLTDPIVRGVAAGSTYGIISINDNASGTILDGICMDDGMVSDSAVSGGYHSAIISWAPGVTLKNITILGSDDWSISSPRFGIRPKETGGFRLEHSRIENIHFDVGGTYDSKYRGMGIIFGPSMNGDPPVIHTVTCRKCHNEGIYMGGSTTVDETVDNGIIEYCTIDQSVQEDGIMVDQTFDATHDYRFSGWTVRYCIISNNSENGLDLKGSSNWQIYGNTIFGNKGNNDGGLAVEGNNRGGNTGGISCGSGNYRSSGHSIYNNLIYNNLGGIYLETGMKIYNNTIVENNTDYTGNNSVWDRTRKPDFCGIHAVDGPSQATYYADVEIENNIIEGHRHGEICLQAAKVSSALINYNNYYDYPISGTRFVEFIAIYNWFYRTFAEWQTFLGGVTNVTGKDANSQNVNSNFIDKVNKDLHLTSQSGVIDGGATLALVTTDKDGVTRPKGIAYDIGAYEYEGQKSPPHIVKPYDEGKRERDPETTTGI